MAFLQQTPLAQAFLLKYAKSFAEKDPTEFCRRFSTDASRLTAESRTELARWVVEKSPLALAKNIQKFAIADESIRIELAHSVAEKAPIMLAQQIQDFAITDEKIRIELAHIVAVKAPGALTRYIQDFKIADEKTRIELAHSIAEKAPITLARRIQDFAITDEKIRIELAHIVTEKAPGNLAEQIQNFAITDEKIRIELAHIVAEKAPGNLAEQIQDFAIADERTRIELAHIVAEKAPDNLADKIQDFAIADERTKIELALTVAEKAPDTLAQHIQKFAIADESTRVRLAKIVAEKNLKVLTNHIQNFAIADESAKVELAHKVAEKDLEMLAQQIQNFAIADESARVELAHKVAEKNPEILTRDIQNFAIANESARVELAHKIAEKIPGVLAWNIQNFAIADERARIELAQILDRKYLPPFLISEGDYLERFAISHPSARASLYASVYLGLIAKGTMRATEERWRNQFFPGDPQSMPLAQVAAQVAPHPVIAGLLTAAEQQPDPHIREILSTWTQLVALRFAADQLPETAWQALKAPLQAIQKWRAPNTRYVLAHLLAQQCLPPEAGDVNGFFAFGKQFTRPHTHLYPTLLFPLFQSATDDPALERLVKLLHRPDFKDAKRQKVMVDALLALTQTDRLPDDLKRALLQAAVPNDSSKEAVRSLTDTASAMQCLVSLAQNEPKLGNSSVLQRLKFIRNPGDFNEQVKGVFQDLFPNLPHAENAATQFTLYQEQARHPTGVLSYAAKMQNGLAAHEKASVLAAIGQFVNAAVLAPAPEKAFLELRYNPAQSPHLRLLADKAPAAFAQWRQPCVYQPSAAFLAQTAGGTKQTDIAAYLKQRIVMDRHVSPGTYALLEEVLAGHRTLTSALQESKRPAASATGVEADLLRLLKGTPVEQKVKLIRQLLESLPQDQLQLHQDLTDLETLLTPSARQDHKPFTVIDTDAAEDLFLCGTEVLGSCQNIQGNPDLNKALMGYALDGKYRMLAIKSEDGPLMGRRMLRLLWDEQKQRPVLHLERLYRNPGIPEKYEQALVELAQQKARQMGCVLVSHDEALPSGGDYRAPLIAHPTPWPFEYVDAEGLGVQAGKEGYQLSEARVVGS